MLDESSDSLLFAASWPSTILPLLMSPTSREGEVGRALLLLPPSSLDLVGSARPLKSASRAVGAGREKSEERDWEVLACLPKSAFITPAM